MTRLPRNRRRQAVIIWPSWRDGTITEVDFGGTGGIFSCSEKEYHITVSGGRLINAGILAAYYTRNPESEFPGLADSLIKNAIGL